ncbi:xaa-pro aminopeptidase, putative [Ichthyophthirius multifiliis]|uniref:Xaa-pro aminopeptidase, putative n=1 Tax=Ichthyophthirius multifiliis TaxID=5932 RepID=G0QVH8_ICHMU|nr:xaa-pro aminopeptidase, putative [Ichthyophthirius multifiliis]EGR30788.1 xaa-pro aminopeptidase, putative [Ichthyophthirius multifiliis]|eukprot:XP_004032375.1 xaa-pro aminopeptidase, putative [Ichthyophthirius multifiliis]
MSVYRKFNSDVFLRIANPFLEEVTKKIKKCQKLPKNQYNQENNFLNIKLIHIQFHMMMHIMFIRICIYYRRKCVSLYRFKILVRSFKPWFTDVSENQKIGFDPLLFTNEYIEKRQNDFKQRNIELLPIEPNLIDEIWINKPEDQIKQISIHDMQFACQSTKDKIYKLKEILKEQNSNQILTSQLDEIAWLLNLRGNDIEYNPVFKSYLIIQFLTENQYEGTLYIDQQKLNSKVNQYLTENHIQTSPYNQIYQDLQEKKKKITIQKSQINQKLYQSIPKEKIHTILGQSTSPISKMKAQKIPEQIKRLKDANIRDQAALVSYLGWLENQIIEKKNTNLNEYTASIILDEKRKKSERNQGLSFPTISSVGSNASIIHYRPQKETAFLIEEDKIYLLDSGGQYLDGTTDITRTFHFGNPKQEEKDAYTRVLLGNIDIQKVIWPKKNQIAGCDIDVLARRHLWEGFQDYGHGTGHGIGYYLNVHEGPHGISKNNKEVLIEGMVVSNEPGYYKDGEFGIRIEDTLVVVNKGNEYLGFECLTLFPYDRNLINIKLLNQNYIEFIDQYHKKVWNILFPILEKEKDIQGIKWLEKNTLPLQYEK